MLLQNKNDFWRSCASGSSVDSVLTLLEGKMYGNSAIAEIARVGDPYAV